MRKLISAAVVVSVAIAFAGAARADLGTVTASYDGQMPGTLWARLNRIALD